MIPVKAVAPLLALAAVGVAFSQAPLTDSRPTVPASISTPDAKSDTITKTSMRSVNFWIMPGAALRIRTMRGSMRSLRGGPVLFDDKTAFLIHLSYAEIGLNGNDITTLMNHHIFAYPGAPLKKLKVHTAR